MALSSNFLWYNREEINNMYLQYQGTLPVIPYRLGIGQTSIQNILYPYSTQRYVSKPNDENITQKIDTIDWNAKIDYVYQFEVPEELNRKIVGVESIYNVTRNRQYKPLRIEQNKIIFDTSPDPKLTLSYDVSGNKNLIDEIIIIYQYIDSWMYVEPKQEYKTFKEEYAYYDLTFHDENQDFSCEIIFDPEVLYNVDLRDLGEEIQLYIISKYDNKFHFYRQYIPNYYNKIYQIDYNIIDYDTVYKIERIFEKQQVGQEEIDETTIKLGEILIDDNYEIEYVPEEDGLFTQKFLVDNTSPNILEQLSEGTVMQFIQQLRYLDSEIFPRGETKYEYGDLWIKVFNTNPQFFGVSYFSIVGDWVDIGGGWWEFYHDGDLLFTWHRLHGIDFNVTVPEFSLFFETNDITFLYVLGDFSIVWPNGKLFGTFYMEQINLDGYDYIMYITRKGKPYGIDGEAVVHWFPKIKSDTTTQIPPDIYGTIYSRAGRLQDIPIYIGSV